MHLHDRFRPMGSENFERRYQRTAPDVRCRSVQGRRTAHRQGFGTLSDTTADRFDQFFDGLLRVPAAELHRDRRGEPAAPVLPRLRRDRRRHRRGPGNLLFAGIPRYINVGGWSTDRPFVVLSPQHVEEAPGFDFSSCDGQPFGGSCNMQVQHDLDHASPAFCTTPDEVHDFIAYAVAHYNVDPARVYVTGLSCGAFGIWEYLAKYHDDLQVAAAVPIAGDGRPAWASVVLRPRIDAALGVPRRARRRRRPAWKHRTADRPCGLPGCPGRRGGADGLSGPGPQQLGSRLRRGERR